MKICPKCNIFKIKNNSYDVCYTCHNYKNDDTQSEPEKEQQEAPYIKEKIPKCLRNSVWRLYFKNKITGLCQCCLIEKISYASFHSGHVKSERQGGTTSLDNLKPICMMCNLSMGQMDMNEFIKKYNMHYRPIIKDDPKIEMKSDSDD